MERAKSRRTTIKQPSKAQQPSFYTMYDGGEDESQWGGLYRKNTAAVLRTLNRRRALTNRRRNRSTRSATPPVFTGFAPLTPPPTPPSSLVDGFAAARPVGVVARRSKRTNRRQPGRFVRLPYADSPSDTVMEVMRRTGVMRKTGRSLPHSHVSGWNLHGANAGRAKKTRKAHLLRQGVELALTAYNRGKKSLNKDGLQRMHWPRFSHYGGGARGAGQTGGILPILPFLAAAAPIAAKAIGLGALGGAGTALGGGLMSKIFK